MSTSTERVRYYLQQLRRIADQLPQDDSISPTDWSSISKEATTTLSRLMRRLDDPAWVPEDAREVVDPDAQLDESVAEISGALERVGPKGGQEPVGLIEEPADGGSVGVDRGEDLLEPRQLRSDGLSHAGSPSPDALGNGDGARSAVEDLLESVRIGDALIAALQKGGDVWRRVAVEMNRDRNAGVESQDDEAVPLAGSEADPVVAGSDAGLDDPEDLEDLLILPRADVEGLGSVAELGHEEDSSAVRGVDGLEPVVAGERTLEGATDTAAGLTPPAAGSDGGSVGEPSEDGPAGEASPTLPSRAHEPHDGGFINEWCTVCHRWVS